MPPKSFNRVHFLKTKSRHYLPIKFMLQMEGPTQLTERNLRQKSAHHTGCIQPPLPLAIASPATNTYSSMAIHEDNGRSLCRTLVVTHYSSSQDYWNTTRIHSSFTPMDPKKLNGQACPAIFFLHVFSRTTSNPTCNAIYYTEFSTMWRYIHRLAISHTSAVFKQTISSSHCMCDQSDHIKSTAWTPSQRSIPSNELADLVTKEAAKWQPASLKLTPASDLIDTLRKNVLQGWNAYWKKLPENNKLQHIKPEPSP